MYVGTLRIVHITHSLIFNIYFFGTEQIATLRPIIDSANADGNR